MALDLGSRGGYDLRFHRKKTKMIGPPKGCTGEQAKARIGVWKGRINFRGEGGYTSSTPAALAAVWCSNMWSGGPLL